MVITPTRGAKSRLNVMGAGQEKEVLFNCQAAQSQQLRLNQSSPIVSGITSMIGVSSLTRLIFVQGRRRPQSTGYSGFKLTHFLPAYSRYAPPSSTILSGTGCSSLSSIWPATLNRSLAPTSITRNFPSFENPNPYSPGASSDPSILSFTSVIRNPWYFACTSVA